MKPLNADLLSSIKNITSWVNQNHWAEMSAGNFSVWRGQKKQPYRIATKKALTLDFHKPLESLANGLILISKSGSRFRDIAHQPQAHLGFIAINASGTCGTAFSPYGKDFYPSSEWWIHLLSHHTLQRNHPEKIALLHAHTLYSTALAKHYPKVSAEKINAFLSQSHHEMKLVFPKGIGFTYPHEPGSNELAHETAQCFADFDVIWWPRHGSISTGKSLEEAFDRMDTSEKNAQLAMLGINENFLE